MRTRTLLAGALVLAAGLCLAIPAMVEAWGTTTFWGCLNCIDNGGSGIVGPTNWECEQVGNEEHGEGTKCQEVDVWEGTLCATSGGPCFNVEAEEPNPPVPEGGY